ncbi:MAG: helicase-exonuclease AddAB subunit AddA, partial [Selenomonadaceae bacterium]|nr:helicase-exonuclease AddAB subunit AddA [Selenomonadaceae bacterium]
MAWTEEQQAAIQTQGKNILVAAAAGSGKTAVLVARILREILTGAVDVDRLLVLTFTNAAAAEMRERIGLALQERLEQSEDAQEIARLERQLILLSGASISTFHAFCQRILRQNIDAVDLDPRFRLAGEQEMTLLRQDAMERVFEAQYEAGEPAFLNFVDAYGDDRGDAQVKEIVRAVADFARAQPFPDAWLDRQIAAYEQAVALPAWENPWLRAGLPEVRRLLADARAEAELALDAARAAASDGYALAASEIARDLETLQHAIAEEADYALVQESIQGFTMPNMRTKPYADRKADKAMKEAFTAHRDRAKKDIAQAAGWFAQDEDAMRQDLLDGAAVVRELVALVRAFYAELQASKKEKNLADFQDLEHFALALLTDGADADGRPLPSPIALALQEHYQEVMVDEYQDTNGVQEAILELVRRADAPNLFTVGDVKQSIYRFRLTDPSFFQQKQKAYAGSAADCALLHLRKNFRSRAHVLDSINALFGQLMNEETMEIGYDRDEALYPGLDYPAPADGAPTLDGPVECAWVDESGETGDAGQEGGEPRAAGRIEAEARYAARRIRALMDAGVQVYDKHAEAYRPIAYRDIVILLRTVKGKAQTVLETLRAAEIPAYADTDAGYFEAQEIRVVLALLTCLDNVRQDIPLAAVMASPIGGFTMREIARIRLASDTGDLYAALLAAMDPAPQQRLSKALAEKAADFQARVARWRRMAREKSVPDLLWLLYAETGYYNYVGGLPGGVLRQANLRMLADRAADYERTNYRGLYRFLRYIENLRKADTDLSAARTLGAGENVVRIMSIHRSKGLEFPVVLLLDLGKSFNMSDARSRLFQLHKTLGIGVRLTDLATAQRYKTLPWKAISAAMTAENKAEELRLLYVALTRAREKLILVTAAPDLEARIEKWSAACDACGEKLPPAMVERADSYLDWILMALLRLPDGRPLRDLAGLPGEGTLAMPQYGQAAFDLRRVGVEDLAPAVAADQKTAAAELLDAVRRGASLAPSDDEPAVRRILGWHYDARGLERVPAKLSVTELKRREDERDETAMPLEAMPVQLVPGEEAVPADRQEEETVSAAGPADGEMLSGAAALTGAYARRPRFLQEHARRTGAEYGTILHNVLQHIDLHGDLSARGIAAQLDAMVRREILTADDRRIVPVARIRTFFASPIGQRMCRAAAVWREKPFCCLFPAKRFYPGIQDASAEIFMQGVLDVLFEEADGRLVLLDYKTDHDPDPTRARRRHAL